jgi:hypothetical protein
MKHLKRILYIRLIVLALMCLFILGKAWLGPPNGPACVSGVITLLDAIAKELV